MTEKLTSIADLPLDILVLIFPYLDATSFLALCSTCKGFQQPSIRLDSAYWSFATRSTFRVPNQPVVQYDGGRWEKMYRRLLTQSRVFTWGSSGQKRLGHSYNDPAMARFPPRRPGRIRINADCSVPTEMEDTRELGVIADMQCGGWSTTLLTSKGSLYTAGALNGMRVPATGDRITLLCFPAGYPTNAAESQYEEPTIAIRQFSAGRAHIMGLSDSGRIWSWYDVKQPALQIKFANIDLQETATGTPSASTKSTYGQVRQVVAGWSRSLAYVQGIGIVVWKTVERGPNDGDTDTMLVLENLEVPKTGYQRTRGKGRESDDEKALGQQVGAVLNFIDLENFVVFTTDIGKVFCGMYGDEDRVQDTIELRALGNGTGAPVDVQGSFRRFAIFKNGEVITADQNYLQACWDAQRTNPEQVDIPGLKRIPALQHNDVISIAFGDYHYMALHANGRITSYGTELSACGALGLGGEADSLARARGIVYDNFSGQGRLLPHAYTRGRQVWFDEKRRRWIEHIIHQGGSNPEEANGRKELFHTNPNVQGEVSEWIEQESKEWDKNTGDDDLGAYFALRVSAAGWHSGALVLVNEDLANRDQGYAFEKKSFPRLRLSDGTDMPGEVDFDEWREGRPEWQFDGDA